MRPFLPLLLVATLGTGGCAQKGFTARRVSPSAQTAANADPGADLAVLSHTVPSPDDPARRDAGARVVNRYAASLLAARNHTIAVQGAPGGIARLRLRRGEGPGGVDPRDFAELDPATEYRLRGKVVPSRVEGVGTPLVGTLKPTLAVSQPEGSPNKPVAGLTWAVTAVPVREGKNTLCLDLYDPHTTGRLPGHGAPPLAADYTTPLAVVSARFQPQNRAMSGVLHANADYANAGVYPTEQPTTEKIPLVLVHGLISDPMDFHYLVNSLAAHPEVRARYQIWVFYYPTSLPVVYSAMLLREDVSRFIHQLDPAGTHPALHRAVLVGHSMGGLLCRMMVSDGGDVYYHHFFRQPMAELRLDAKQRRLVRRGFYYRASPDVGQVVFVATPHRGSSLARGFPGNLARLLVRVPTAVMGRVRPIVMNNRAALAPGAPLKPSTSIDSLSPRDPVIAALQDMPLRRGVRLHSILGDRGRGGPPEKSSDGVVPYKSSHLPQAESERFVPAGHTGTLHRPETADELVRILAL